MLSFVQFLNEELIRPKYSLGLSRDEMPQIRRADIPDFLAFLSSHGVSHHEEMVQASSLKPVQNEINGDKVRSMVTTVDKPMLVSSDGYIMDGHHRWQKAVWDNTALRIVRLSMKILPLIELAKKYPKVEMVGINHFRQAA